MCDVPMQPGWGVPRQLGRVLVDGLDGVELELLGLELFLLNLPTRDVALAGLDAPGRICFPFELSGLKFGCCKPAGGLLEGNT